LLALQAICHPSTGGEMVSHFGNWEGNGNGNGNGEEDNHPYKLPIENGQ
jgi:hypothetical protein